MDSYLRVIHQHIFEFLILFLYFPTLHWIDSLFIGLFNFLAFNISNNDTINNFIVALVRMVQGFQAVIKLIDENASEGWWGKSINWKTLNQQTF